MKIGVYDKWLSSFGGGEKVATVMAECLSNAGYKVDLISNFDVEKEELEKKMGVNLPKVRMVFWPERSYQKLDSKTKKYDLFINVSFFDHLPSKAKKSIYYIHFPTPIKRSLWGLVKYETILPFLRKYLIIPEIVKGLRYIDEVVIRGGKWLSNENIFVFSNSPERFSLKIRVYAEKLIVSSLDALSFASPNASVEIKDKYIDHNNNVLTYELTVRLKKKENFILHIVNSENSFDNSMGLVSLTINDFRFLLWNFIKRYLPTYEMALYGSSLYKPAAGLDTYDLFLANSRFTIKWTEKYWGKSANLLYPPVDVQKFKPGKKENIILNVGRFFTGGHSKRQDILVEVFKGLIDSGRLDKSWELHLVGGVASGEEHRNFFLSMRNQADEYPIFFHTQMGFQELKKLYSRAKIYWHATGYGGDENKSPITFEHFGITVVEAMAAGCVPVVFRGGGLTETVDSSDLTWRSKERLETITLNLINNPKVMKKHSLYAVHRAQRYSRENFEKRFLGIVGNIIGNKNG